MRWPRAGGYARGRVRHGRSRRAAGRLPRRRPRADPVRALERAVGRPADAGAPCRAPAPAPHPPARGGRRRLRAARHRLRPAARRARASRSRPRPSTTPSGRRRSATTRPRPFTALFVGRDVPEKGLAVLVEAWRRAALADGRLSVVGADAHGRPRGGPQLLRRRRRSGHTFARHTPLPRAVGARRQRSHEPAPPRHRHRCGGRRRRRARAPRAQRPRRPRRRPRRPRRAPCARCTTTPTCAHGWAPTPRRDVAPYTHAAWAEGFAAALRGATGQELPC